MTRKTINIIKANDYTFNKLSTSTNQSAYIRRITKYTRREQMTTDQPKRLGDLIAPSYQILEQNYRHEYFYKNKLLNDYVLMHYALDDTVLLNEFRVGDSIVDVVLVNGTNKVFEIKTELDTPERLKPQLDDYYKAFTEVYVFTHTTLADNTFVYCPLMLGYYYLFRLTLLLVNQSNKIKKQVDFN